MRWTFETGSSAAAKAEGLAVGVFDDLNFKGVPGAKQVRSEAERLRFKGAAGESFFAFNLAGKPAKHLLVIGSGQAGASRAGGPARGVGPGGQPVQGALPPERRAGPAHG